ncbi:hypothetical protein Pmar_PMAR022203, partial [Perkinsus marinus ATCC 50983]
SNFSPATPGLPVRTLSETNQSDWWSKMSDIISKQLEDEEGNDPLVPPKITTTTETSASPAPTSPPVDAVGSGLRGGCS